MVGNTLKRNQMIFSPGPHHRLLTVYYYRLRESGMSLPVASLASIIFVLPSADVPFDVWQMELQDRKRDDTSITNYVFKVTSS